MGREHGFQRPAESFAITKAKRVHLPDRLFERVSIISISNPAPFERGVSEVDKTSKSSAKLLKAQNAADYHHEVELKEPSDQQLPREVVSKPSSVDAFSKRMVNEPVILEEAEVRDQQGEVISMAVLQDMVSRAKQNLEKAYCTYSKFHVGANLLTTKGQFDGVNVENASYGLTICAERSAMCSAISQHGKHEFRAIAIATTSPHDTWAAPCGACRQFLVEFGDFPVILTNNKNEKVKIIKTKELLPDCFCPDDM
ncbi:unnamed protein product [Oikopleura dioica]|uniref:cytidine deaminase n=2 Tax=Oikopleura dioica TaxID=34765 RepID=E4YXB0_OIKDI|nr:unnamed protein product [Oikopleura dioica]